MPDIEREQQLLKVDPAFQEYFRKSKPPLLAIWGKHDPFFIPPRSRGLPVRQPERDGPISGYGTLRTGDACRGDRFRHAAASREERGLSGTALTAIRRSG